MIIFVFQKDNDIRLSYSTEHDVDTEYLGCGVTREDLWQILHDKVTHKDFRRLYTDCIRSRLSDWKDNPFERMKQQDFIERYPYRGEEDI